MMAGYGSADMPKTESKQTPADTDAEIRFEDAIERLEDIIGRMESERVPLDQLLTDYEQGTALLKLCRERIEHARERVETINKGLASAAPKAADSDTDGGEDPDDDDTPLF